MMLKMEKNVKTVCRLIYGFEVIRYDSCDLGDPLMLSECSDAASTTFSDDQYQSLIKLNKFKSHESDTSQN